MKAQHGSSQRRLPAAGFSYDTQCFSLGNISFSSSAYLDVSVQRVPSIYLCIQHMVTEGCSAGFPHSEISGSSDICSSPLLIAAYHVFLRLSVPRHPPCALSCLTFLYIVASYRVVFERALSFDNSLFSSNTSFDVSK